MLQLSYRGRVADDAEVTVSDEHLGAQWVRPGDMRGLLREEFIEELSAGDDRIRSLLSHIAVDLDRYLARVAAQPGGD
jgi:hypothetical protein